MFLSARPGHYVVEQGRRAGRRERTQRDPDCRRAEHGLRLLHGAAVYTRTHAFQLARNPASNASRCTPPPRLAPAVPASATSPLPPLTAPCETFHLHSSPRASGPHHLTSPWRARHRGSLLKTARRLVAPTTVLASACTLLARASNRVAIPRQLARQLARQ